MKVIFKQIAGGSGVDVWANKLSNGLINRNVDSSVVYFPSYYSFFPQLLAFKKDSNEHFIVHSNIAYGSYFKKVNPLVVTEHHLVHDSLFFPYSSFSQKAYYKFVYMSEKKSLRVADAVTCVSSYTKQKLEEVFGYCDSKLIYNGIDIEEFQPYLVEREKYGISNEKTVLFFAGNLSTRKGADLLPMIMKRLGNDFLLLITSGLRSNSETNLDNIKSLGKLDEKELVDIYNLCDIFLFPSRLEGFGLAVAEAMACGKPIVTTNCSSLPELVVDGKGGFLCEVDNVDDFVSSIEIIAEDENLKKNMGRFNRNRILKLFTLERMVNQYINLYNSL